MLLDEEFSQQGTVVNLRIESSDPYSLWISYTDDFETDNSDWIIPLFLCFVFFVWFFRLYDAYHLPLEAEASYWYAFSWIHYLSLEIRHFIASLFLLFHFNELETVDGAAWVEVFVIHTQD